MYDYDYSNMYPYPYVVPVYPVFQAPIDTNNESQRQKGFYSNLKDYGNQPFVLNIEDAAEQNRDFRRAIWTGEHLQVVLMSLRAGEDIGLEVHPYYDQFFRIEEGHGLVQMGDSKDNLTFQRRVKGDDAIMVPAGTWHNVTNTGRRSLKLFTIYAPPAHPAGTVHHTKSEAMASE